MSIENTSQPCQDSEAATKTNFFNFLSRQMNLDKAIISMGGPERLSQIIFLDYEDRPGIRCGCLNSALGEDELEFGKRVRAELYQYRAWLAEFLEPTAKRSDEESDFYERLKAGLPKGATPRIQQVSMPGNMELIRVVWRGGRFLVKTLSRLGLDEDSFYDHVDKEIKKYEKWLDQFMKANKEGASNE